MYRSRAERWLHAAACGDAASVWESRDSSVGRVVGGAAGAVAIIQQTVPTLLCELLLYKRGRLASY